MQQYVLFGVIWCIACLAAEAGKSEVKWCKAQHFTNHNGNGETSATATYSKGITRAVSVGAETVVSELANVGMFVSALQATEMAHEVSTTMSTKKGKTACLWQRKAHLVIPVNCPSVDEAVTSTAGGVMHPWSLSFALPPSLALPLGTVTLNAMGTSAQHAAGKCKTEEAEFYAGDYAVTQSDHYEDCKDPSGNLNQERC